ncbi:hypothetical protein SUSAZ_08430 [Sulfolobus acidocaldarius SUSAZ]|nr:hypothetical protein SUSAZ_08430 [Sulfolobus acidocaldarius SUSAZ]
MKIRSIIYIIVSIILAYVFELFVLYPFTAILVGIPLGLLTRKYSVIAGFLVGFIASLSLYLLYPLGNVVQLADKVGGILGLNGVIVVLLYPLIYGIISLLTALIVNLIIKKTSTSNK